MLDVRGDSRKVSRSNAMRKRQYSMDFNTTRARVLPFVIYMHLFIPAHASSSSCYRYRYCFYPAIEVVQRKIPLLDRRISCTATHFPMDKTH